MLRPNYKADANHSRRVRLFNQLPTTDPKTVCISVYLLLLDSFHQLTTWATGGSYRASRSPYRVTRRFRSRLNVTLTPKFSRITRQSCRASIFYPNVARGTFSHSYSSRTTVSRALTMVLYPSSVCTFITLASSYLQPPRLPNVCTDTLLECLSDW